MFRPRVFVCGFVLVVLGAVAAFSLYLARDLPDVRALKRVDGITGFLWKSLGEKDSLARRNFRPVCFTELPPHVIDAFTAAWDREFFTSAGRESRRETGGRVRQWLVRRLLCDGPEAAQSRLHRYLLSLLIDLRLSREEEFTAWMNSLYFGNHAYGIEAAGRIYFGRSVSELSLAEAAMLAALPFAPATYNPAVDPESVRNRRKWVLLTMRDHGFITPEECLFASLMPVVPPVPPARIAPAPLLSHY